MHAAFVYLTVSTALYYVLNWAKISRPLWRRYPPRLRAFLGCAACSSFWVGLALGAAGASAGWELFGVVDWQPPLAAAWCMITTPPVARWLIYSLQDLSAATQASADSLVQPSEGE